MEDEKTGEKKGTERMNKRINNTENCRNQRLIKS
jgi:hypothetical protein